MPKIEKKKHAVYVNFIDFIVIQRHKTVSNIEKHNYNVRMMTENMIEKKNVIRVIFLCKDIITSFRSCDKQ